MTTNVIDAIREKEADAHAEREEAFAERNRINQAFFDGKLIAYAEVLRLLGEDLMACDSVWEQGELYSEDLLLAAFKPAIDEHDRQIAEQAWEDGYIQALKNMNPMPGEEPPEYTPNPYRKENA